MAIQYHGTAWVLGNMRKLLNLWSELLELDFIQIRVLAFGMRRVSDMV
jgi:hypothetical protein